MEAVELARLKQAYALLGVLPDSSALAIRRAFGMQARRRRPSRFPEGSPQRARAAEEIARLREAFRFVRHAPLRFHAETPGVAPRAGRRGPKRSAPAPDWLEWLVRFAAGAAFGLFVLVFHLLLPLPLPVLVCVPLATGLGSVLGGDRFWHAVLRSALWWA